MPTRRASCGPSRTSLVQTIGRAARNVDGRVLLYADRMTDSLRYAIEETDRRRTRQSDWNDRARHHAAIGAHQIGEAMTSVFEQDYVTVAPIKDCRDHRHGRQGSEGLDRRDREAHARGRRRPGVRGPLPGCATSSSGWRRSISAWSRRRRRRRHAGARRRSRARRSRLGRGAAGMIRRSGGVGVGDRGAVLSGRERRGRAQGPLCASSRTFR